LCTKQRLPAISQRVGRERTIHGALYQPIGNFGENSDMVQMGLGSSPRRAVNIHAAPHAALRSTCAGMNEVFWRQFVTYPDYHRDKRNCAMHIIGTPLLFLAAVLPFSLLSVTVWGMSTTAAALLVIPALIFWMVLDLTIGAAIACAVIPLLITAATTVKHVGVAWVWATTAMLIVIGWSLQIVGHSFFEQRRPALLDSPLHMLMSPMFIVVKLFVTLGFRRDLAAVLSEQASDKAPNTECGQGW
jgi:uncharacterized membrane protein YGL010W